LRTFLSYLLVKKTCQRNNTIIKISKGSEGKLIANSLIVYVTDKGVIKAIKNGAILILRTKRISDKSITGTSR